MIQIGIHNTGYFSSAALCRDGKILYASPEERLSRKKYDNSFPWRSISRGLHLNALSLDDVDEILLSWNPFINAAGRLRRGFSEWVPHPMQRLYSNINHLLPRLTLPAGAIDVSEETVQYANGKKLRLIFVNHHLSHIGLSLYTSPFEDAAIMIADGYGEKSSTLLLKYSKEKGFETLRVTDFPHSLGMFYSTFTEFIGFEPDKDEWKLMGASAYGRPDVYYDKVKRLISVYDNGEYELDLSYFNFYNYDTPNSFSSKFISLFGEPNDNDSLSQREYDIAAAVQKVFEETVFKLLNFLHFETKNENLCLGGGTFLNGLLNGKISSNTPFKNVFIPFSPDDAGNAIGALLYMNKTRLPHLMPYLGDIFTPESIRTMLSAYKIDYTWYDDDDELQAFVADTLHKGKIVGWFQGRMEFGQRALGNRSILANPKEKVMKDIVNRAVKYRESFRPFAPSILCEDGAGCFENFQDTPYMERVLRFRKSSTTMLQAVVHEDGTGRLQTVQEAGNPRFCRLIRAFKERSQIPALLNTSFNKAGEPIVCSPDDALRTFFTSGLDMLVLEQGVIEKKA